MPLPLICLLNYSSSFSPIFETGSHYIVLAGLQFTVTTRLASNAQRSTHPYLPRAEVKGVCIHMPSKSSFWKFQLNPSS